MLDARAALGAAGYVEVGARLAAADGFGAAGDSQRATAELQLARRQLELRIAQIPEPAWRQHYVSASQDNARLLATSPATVWQI